MTSGGQRRGASQFRERGERKERGRGGAEKWRGEGREGEGGEGKGGEGKGGEGMGEGEEGRGGRREGEEKGGGRREEERRGKEKRGGEGCGEERILFCCFLALQRLDDAHYTGKSGSYLFSQLITLFIFSGDSHSQIGHYHLYGHPLAQSNLHT